MQDASRSLLDRAPDRRAAMRNRNDADPASTHETNPAPQHQPQKVVQRDRRFQSWQSTHICK
jgi:hypothetical protein